MHGDPVRQTLIERLSELGETVIGPGPPTQRVVATGVSDLYRYAGEAELADGAARRAPADLLRQLGLRSVLIVPMRVPGRIIGAMTLATDISQRRPGDDDVELAEQLGRRAAIAVENSRLHAQLSRVWSSHATGVSPGAARCSRHGCGICACSGVRSGGSDAGRHERGERLGPERLGGWLHGLGLGRRTATELRAGDRDQSAEPAPTGRPVD